ncbi:HAD-IA family hydrolase [Sphingobacterium sp. DK4209]|uniref:HAD-IA family hydrolase n=1 Tax=Sphingobacterium zhuxiongii TaxID=2662364 RepID=A0A5Q0QA11_9SPHI|nr:MULTISPECIES: HAD-IA family hydrolase [unclassified Sphingobacterium]MVZ65167.1 HAD-IA family hydrolase [Sphingobacterium sp. DK4209]QGA26114.1 HAD-IA family hydrolase [Sphingobacterium sp. dk4302]
MNEQSLYKYLKLKELSTPFKALLFDVDGTLADNMYAHKASYVAAAKEYGITLNPDLIDETAGWPTVAVAKEISQRYQVELDFEVFAKRKSAIFIQEFIQQTKPIDFVRQILFDFHDIKKIAVVSGGSRSTLNITLDVIEVKGKYQTLVCAGDTEFGKPSPQPFLLAAEHLQVDPIDCLVFEDGDPGVQGAIAAGMSWVRIDEI